MYHNFTTQQSLNYGMILESFQFKCWSDILFLVSSTKYPGHLSTFLLLFPPYGVRRKLYVSKGESACRLAQHQIFNIIPDTTQYMYECLEGKSRTFCRWVSFWLCGSVWSDNYPGNNARCPRLHCVVSNIYSPAYQLFLLADGEKCNKII